MPIIDPDMAVHKLNINPNQKPVFLKTIHLRPASKQAVDQEVQKLLNSKFI